MMSKNIEYIPDVPAGNTVALVGIGKYLCKTGTIITNPKSFPIRNMKYSVSPVVRVVLLNQKMQLNYQSL